MSSDFKNFAERFGIPLNNQNESRNIIVPTRERLKTAITLHREQRISRMKQQTLDGTTGLDTYATI